ncbi:hypothetical protein [Nocardia sp. NPDC127526]|uniref:hypothetical protein n=1 Tax=Nocardia sp. NPDC127526 TaxID=3345393 RepID=UPI0036407937
MVDDVEKRWHDPQMFRQAVKYVVAVLVVTAVAAGLAVVWASSRQACLGAESMLCDTPSRLVVGMIPGGILLLGGLGAFAITVREWRAGRAWPIWQGAGWFLLVLMVVYLSVAGGV